jgi:hypothetical protein
MSQHTVDAHLTLASGSGIRIDDDMKGEDISNEHESVPGARCLTTAMMSADCQVASSVLQDRQTSCMAFV